MDISRLFRDEARSSQMLAGVKRPPWWATAILGALAAAFLYYAATRKLWLDELYTPYIAQQPSVRALIDALLDPSDGMPPAYALCVHALEAFLGETELAIRLPAYLGFLGACASLYAFVAKRISPECGVVAILVLWQSAGQYATEGRAYGAVLGCVGAAMICWQRSTEPERPAWVIPAFGLALAGATAFHYYGIFAIPAFGVAELVRYRTTGSLDRPTFVAMAAAPLILLPHVPLIRVAQPLMPFFWSKATKESFAVFASEFFGPLALCIPALALVAAYDWVRRRGPGRERPQTAWPRLPKHERALALALAATPILAIAVARFTTGAFVPRYVVFSMLGVAALIAPLSTWRWVRPTRLILILACAVFVRLFFSFPQLNRTSAADTVLPQLLVLPDQPRTIAISDHIIYMETFYYAPLAVKSRLVLPINPALDRKYYMHDAGGALLSSLRKRVPLTVEDLADFLGRNEPFVLLTRPGEWMTRELKARRWRMHPISSKGPVPAFEVDPPLGHSVP
jgi:hypothetical protein